MTAPKAVFLTTRTVGSCFATQGALKTRRGRVVATCDKIRPYGMKQPALADAAELARVLGLPVIEG